MLRVAAFAGIRPAMLADLLQPGEAQQAVNTKLIGGALAPLKAPLPLMPLASSQPVKSLYRFGQELDSETEHWFEFTGDADVVKGPVDNDTEERTYWTDGAYPKKTNSQMATGGAPYPSASYRIGIPAPAGQITATVSGEPTNESDPFEAVTYVVTYVSAWQEEGPPNVASAVVQWKPGQTITLTGLPGAPTGAYNITGKRIYRSASGSQSTKFQLVNIDADIGLATTSYTDTKPTKDLGEVLSTTGWGPPPDAMVGLTSMGNGMLAGFEGNTLHFCEPYAPYAWPSRYQRSTDAPIVGIAAFDQSLFVGTTTGLYVFTGIDPASLSSEKLAVAQSCVSKRSIVAMGGAVLFASPDGLFSISARGLENLTDGLLTREQWQAYKPASISAYESDNRYIAFFDTGTRRGSLVFTFGSQPTLAECDVFATAGYRDSKQDGLYLAVDNQLCKWDAGAALAYTWASGIFHLPHDANMGAASVDADAYPLTFGLYADEQLVHTQTVTSRYAFRLPSGYRSMRYHFRLEGSALVREVRVGRSMTELMGG